MKSKIRKSFDIIVAFVVLFFFCHGLGALLLTQLLDDTEIALSISLLLSMAITLVIMTLDYFGVFEKNRDTKDIIDDILDDEKK